jgi:GNAT superfamily N-acetyltransferase
MHGVGEIYVRDAVVADAPAIAEAHARSWQAAYSGIIPDEALDGISIERWTERRAASLDDASDTRTLVAVLDDQVIGFTSFGPFREDGGIDPEVGEVRAIYVHPDYWGLGAGRALLSKTVTRLAAHGYPEVRLWVLEENDRSRSFYERHGFSFDGMVAEYTPGIAPDTVLLEVRYSRSLVADGYEDEQGDGHPDVPAARDEAE